MAFKARVYMFQIFVVANATILERPEEKKENHCTLHNRSLESCEPGKKKKRTKNISISNKLQRQSDKGQH